jgi:hypothetical protein
MATRPNAVSDADGLACPACGSNELRWGAPFDALWHAQCHDCGIIYGRSEEGELEPICPGCGLQHDEQETGAPFCEDCGLSDCVFCGTPTLGGLSENLACPECEDVDAA